MFRARRITTLAGSCSHSNAFLRQGLTLLTTTAILHVPFRFSSSYGSQLRVTQQSTLTTSSSLLLAATAAPLCISRRYQSEAASASDGRVDGHTSASVVVVDPEAAAKERDRLARSLLTTNFPPKASDLLMGHVKQVVQLKDVALTVPYTLSFVVDTSPIAAACRARKEEKSLMEGKEPSVLDEVKETAEGASAAEGEKKGAAAAPRPAASVPKHAEEDMDEKMMLEEIKQYKLKMQEKAMAVLTECFNMVDKHLNNFNAESEISKLNALPAHENHHMSQELYDVLQCIVEVYRSSGSCFDPACGSLTSHLREKVCKHSNSTDPDNFAALNLKVPNQVIRKHSLPNSFKIDFEARTISKNIDEARLDLGGLNKGYTVDRVVEGLKKIGIENCLFEWGGDCKAIGRNAHGAPWAVGIVRPPTIDDIISHVKTKLPSSGSSAAVLMEHFRSTVSDVGPNAPQLLRVVELNNEALCTSGDYENLMALHTNFLSKSTAPDNTTQEEVRSNISLFTSIFDWQDRTLLRPSEDNLAQVSVRCYSCMYADAFATAGIIKKTPERVRFMLEPFRWDYNRVTDYTLYTRHEERMAHMHEIAKERPEQREARIASSLPARVVVIGGGLAGCSAAIEAARSGAQVILIEKEANLGGNSAKATSGINGWGTRAQSENRVQDNCKLFERDTYLSGKGGTCDPGLVRALSVKSGEAIDWLIKFGIPLTVLYQLGGHSRQRCHRVPDTPDGKPVPVGYTIMSTLRNYIATELKHKITILSNTAVVDLIHESYFLPDGNRDIFVKGVRYRSTLPQTDAADNDTSNNNKKSLPKRPKTRRELELEEQRNTMSLYADAVVLATGGFSNDQTANSLLREYAPQLFGVPTTNGTFATGDGVKIASKIGATLVDMDKVQLHPTGLINPKDPANKTKILGPEALRGSGGILLNQYGERFINELDLRSVVSQAILAQEHEYPNSGGSKFAYCVLGEAAAKKFGINSLTYYWKELNVFTRVDTVEDLAKLMDCPLETLQQTLEDYEALATSGRSCPLTGKMVYPSVVGPKGPYYVAFVTPSIHYTMGGCLISPSAEILTQHDHMTIFDDKKPIYGLFGAGEVTGGVHGKNRLGGNSLLECVVFGRIAGDRAATILQREKVGLKTEQWMPVVVSEVRSGDKFGIGSRVLRFNLPGALQQTGLAVGQFIGIQGNWDGQQLIGYYSPITLPDDKGRITILARGDKGNLQEWISSLRPGDSVQMKACGGLRIDRDPIKKQLSHQRTPIRQLGLVAGGSGVAPMIQLIRAALSRPYIDHIDSIRLVYAAEDEGELTYRELLRGYMEENPDKFSVTFVLNSPPEGWTDGVGYVVKQTLQKYLQPPAKDLLVAICGPPVMQQSVLRDLRSLGYSDRLTHTVDEEVIL